MKHNKTDIKKDIIIPLAIGTGLGLAFLIIACLYLKGII